MNRLASAIIGAVLLLAGAAYVNAQLVPAPGPPTAIACAYNSSPPTVASGNAVWVQCTEEGKLDVNASVSASISGFEPATTGTPVVADTDGETETLPAGDVVVAFNTSTSITAYCMLGAAATVADVAIPPSSWFAFTVGAATQLTCITASSTATVNTVGGAGLPTGAGGGGGGGSGSLDAVATAAAPSYGEGASEPLSMDLSGGLRVNVVTATGTAQNTALGALTGNLVFGSVTTSAPTFTTGNVNPISLRTDGALRTGLYAGIEGGCTPAKTLSAATTNATSIKASAGTLCKMIAVNTTATVYYLKLYNTSSAPTCNSDTVVGTYPIPPNNGGVAIPLGPFAEAYTTGIGFCLTAGIADNDNTSAATGVAISYSFK